MSVRRTVKIPSATARASSPGALRCRRGFLSVFPAGFRDETYIDWERDYKWAAHEEWQETLAPDGYRRGVRLKGPTTPST